MRTLQERRPTYPEPHLDTGQLPGPDIVQTGKRPALQHDGEQPAIAIPLQWQNHAVSVGWQQQEAAHAEVADMLEQISSSTDPGQG